MWCDLYIWVSMWPIYFFTNTTVSYEFPRLTSHEPVKVMTLSTAGGLYNFSTESRQHYFLRYSPHIFSFFSFCLFFCLFVFFLFRKYLTHPSGSLGVGSCSDLLWSTTHGFKEASRRNKAPPTSCSPLKRLCYCKCSCLVLNAHFHASVSLETSMK